jgi:DNA-binding SARP family transcriptional activator/tetratricopeptide (TPR) repeat protein
MTRMNAPVKFLYPQPVAAITRDIGIRVLGPIEARASSGWLTAPPQSRFILALLALQVGHVVPVRDLIDALWPDAPPTSARASIQAMVTRLRQILADLPTGAVERRGDGYRLMTPPNSVDVQQFRLLVQAARGAANAAEAVEAFDQALALWRGPALADVPGTTRVEAIRFALAEERLSAMQDRVGRLLDLGQDQQAAEELTGLLAAHPLAERLAGLLMVALYRGGRQADALQVFRDLRGRLSAELAIEPDRDLQTLHQQILAGDLVLPVTSGWLRTPVTPLPREAEPVPAREEGRPVPRQLPTGVAHFTGRTAELEALDTVLERANSADGAVAIAAISGMAGVGKTSLALHWAHQVAHRFPDGQLHANLRAFGSWRWPTRATDAIRDLLDGLGVPKAGRPTGIEAQAALYRSALAGKRVLVILDNAADEEQVRPLLPGSDGCLVIVTSRRRLAGLSACEGALLLNLDVMSQQDSIELLEMRLGAAVTAVPETANQLAVLCGRLPLALSIAAVRAAESRTMDLAALTRQLQDVRDRLDVLDVGGGGSSVRAVLSWSYQNLSEPAARTFRLLGAHPGPDIGVAAVASLVGHPVVQTLPILAELVRAHVLTEQAPNRWVFNGLLRAYANEQGRREDYHADQNAAMQRVLDYYVHTAWSAAAMLPTAFDPAFRLGAPVAGVESESIKDATRAGNWYDAEYKVLQAATSWAAAEGFDGYAWRLPWALMEYLVMSGRCHEAAVTMQTALAAADRAGDIFGQARAHHGLGATLGPAHPESASHIRKALRPYRDLADDPSQTAARHSLGLLFQRQGHTQAALREAEQGLLLARDSGDTFHEARALNDVGWLHAETGRYELSLRLCRQALILQSSIRDRYGEACTLDTMGYAHHKLGDNAEAGEYYQRALQSSNERAAYLRAAILDHIGDNSAATAQPTAAHDFWQQAMAILNDVKGADTSGIRQKLSA